MQKSSNSSKKGVISSECQPGEYKSEMSKASSVSRGKQKFSVQNIKDFKYQIDHQIAKCLDTLDRQGLKFLKETLRASKIFGLNTQELMNTLPIEENLQFQSQQLQAKQKSPPKKNNPKNIVVKKVTKAEPQNKPVTALKTTRNDTKNNLGDNIHKKLQSMKIKTGKKQEIKGIEQIKNVESERTKNVEQKSQNYIAEEIDVQQGNEQSDTINKNSFFKTQQQKSKEANYTLRKVQEQKNQIENKEKSENVIQNEKIEQKITITPNKPFCKKQFKKPQYFQGHKNINQDYGIEINREQQIRQLIETNQNEIRNTYKPRTQILNNPNFNSQKIILSNTENKSEDSQKFQKMQENVAQQSKSIEPQMLNLLAKINKLSPNKRGKLQRIIQKLQQNPLIETSMLSIGSNNPKVQVSYMKPYIPQKNSFFKQSNASQKSKSRSKLQKIQKASSIKGSMTKRIKNQGVDNSPVQFDKKNSESRIQQSFQRQKLNQPGSQTSIKYVQKRQSKNQSLKLRNQEEGPKSLQNSLYFIEKEESFSSALVESGQKLIKIGKKKSQPSNVVLKILSNNGHPTLVSLSNILFYSQSGDIIQIQETNLKQSNPKIIKLFTLNSQNWTTQLKNAKISIQNILQTIGGVRIINFNKSEIENNKQADLAELFINQQLQWRGQLKGGSFKQDQQYITDIKISSKDFVFPSITNSSVTKSKLFSQQKSMRQSLFDLKQKKGKETVAWLQKESVYEKMKEIQESEKNQTVTKKIQSIRNTSNSLPSNKPLDDKLVNQQQSKKIQEKSEIVLGKNISRLRPSQDYSLQNVSSPKDKFNKIVLKQSEDILGQLGKSIGIKKKNNSKQQSIVAQNNKMEDFLIKKEKQQDDQFEKILKSLQQREKEQSLVEKESNKEVKKINQDSDIQQFVTQKKGKKVVQKSMEQFMKDSLFDDIPKHLKAQTIKNATKEQAKNIQKAEFPENKSIFKKKSNNLDDLIDQLNDVVGNQNADETGQEFCIPELPKGRQMVLIILSNWGNQYFSGLNGIQIFDSNGDIIKPTNITSSSIPSRQIVEKVCKLQFLTSDQQMQLKLPKSKKTVLAFNFPYKVELSAIRIWNYNGHRVHSNIGIRKCHLKLDNIFIFSGEIQQSTGSSQDAYKYCQYILFTQNSQVLKKISDKDWINSKRNSNESERILFKSTLQNFHRPTTRNDQQNVKKEIKIVQMKKQFIRLPKRLCFEYEPPLLPEGFTMKIVLHSSWGDHFFIGLNGIQMFNEKGQNITKLNLSQIRAEPSSISGLAGYERDKRVVNNLINGKNNTTSDSDIWLTPLLSDIEKIEKSKSNFILVEFTKLTKIAGINFYNYTKTPQRGVRQIEVYIDKYLLYRGYLRKYNEQEGIIHTTINFTKQQALLQAMNYVGYNEDHLQQQVGLINEGKVIKQGSIPYVSQQNLIRPMTGKLLV